LSIKTSELQNVGKKQIDRKTMKKYDAMFGYGTYTLFDYNVSNNLSKCVKKNFDDLSFVRKVMYVKKHDVYVTFKYIELYGLYRKMFAEYKQLYTKINEH
jgi:hypothetical protein